MLFKQNTWMLSVNVLFQIHEWWCPCFNGFATFKGHFNFFHVFVFSVPLAKLYILPYKLSTFKILSGAQSSHSPIMQAFEWELYEYFSTMLWPLNGSSSSRPLWISLLRSTTFSHISHRNDVCVIFLMNIYCFWLLRNSKKLLKEVSYANSCWNNRSFHYFPTCCAHLKY